jgi:hypothetical protein
MIFDRVILLELGIKSNFKCPAEIAYGDILPENTSQIRIWS